MAKSRKGRFVIIALLLLIAGGATGWYFWSKREKPLTVQIEKVGRRDLTELVQASGRIQPVIQVVINPEVSGEIIELPVKEGMDVKKGDLLLKIKPDYYAASRNSAEASYKSALSSRSQAAAELERARAEFERNTGLFDSKLVSESIFIEVKTAFEVAKLRHEAALHQTDVAKASLARAEEDLKKTTIYSPIDGTVVKLKSQVGERVVGTAMMAGTEIMTVANLADMEARVDIGETDVVLIKIGQKARLEVDAFKEAKFTGKVTEIANAAKGAGGSANSMSSSSQQEATKFEVRIRILERENFRPGMSVTADIETRHRTNVLTVPIQSVTVRVKKEKKPEKEEEQDPNAQKKQKEPERPPEVVFLKAGDIAKMVPVTRGISDDAHTEIISGLKEGDEVISGGFKAINRELEDGKKIVVGKDQPEKK